MSYVHVTRASGEYGDCCMGAAMFGVGSCTCWEPEHDVVQEPVQEGPMEALAKCCFDCAYRAGSPEREDDLPLPHDAAHAFACHQGMRRRVRYRHPDGRVEDAEPGEYDGPHVARKTALARTWRSDGRPGQLCGGWATVAGVR